MENYIADFDKFVVDLEKREKARQQRKKNLSKADAAWEARRRFERLYRENHLNRVYAKK